MCTAPRLKEVDCLDQRPPLEQLCCDHREAFILAVNDLDLTTEDRQSSGLRRPDPGLQPLLALTSFGILPSAAPPEVA